MLLEVLLGSDTNAFSDIQTSYCSVRTSQLKEEPLVPPVAEIAKALMCCEQSHAAEFSHSVFLGKPDQSFCNKTGIGISSKEILVSSLISISQDSLEEAILVKVADIGF